MRYLLAFAVVGILAGTAAQADTMKNCAATWKGMSAADKAKTTYKAFSTDCMKGTSANTAATPAMAAPMPPNTPTSTGPAMKPAAMAAKPMGAPAGATGVCKDGTYTMSKTHSGACSHHKGVDKWL